MTGGIERQFMRRLWGAVIFALATALLAAIHGEVGGHVYVGIWSFRLKLVELTLAILVVFGLGSTLMVRAWHKARAGRLDLNGALCCAAILTLAYGILALAFPELFPLWMRRADTGVHPHFEASVFVTVVALYLDFVQQRAHAGAAPKTVDAGQDASGGSP